MLPVNRHKEIDLVATVTTPENVQFEFRISGFARRLPAFLMDLFLRLAILFLVLFALSCAGTFSSQFVDATMFAILLITFFLLSWLYGAYFEYRFNGQTLGKKLLGIRVVMSDGRTVSLVAAIIRNLCRTADIMPIFVWQFADDTENFGLPIPLFMSGIVCMLITKNFQRLGDVAANTIVVIVEREYTNRYGDLRDKRMDEIAASLPVDLVLQPATVQSLSLYIDRRSRLVAVQREEICAPFVDAIRSRYDLSREYSNDFIVCALHYREFYLRDESAALDLFHEQQETSAGNQVTAMGSLSR